MSSVTTLTIGADAIVPRAERDNCGESPVWAPDESALYWVDIPAGRVHRYATEEGRFSSWALTEQVGCIARRKAGGVLAACESGLFTLDLENGTQERVADIRHAAEGMRFNDGHCDRAGRMWVTSFMMASAKQPVGGLYRFDRNGLSAKLLDGFMTPNGMAFSPDDRTLYIADSHAEVRKIWAVGFDRDSGELGARRLFVDMAQFAGRPDGAAMDTDGCYWVAGMDAGCLYRFTPAGALDCVVELPVRHPTMCCFGGAGLDEMFVTSLKRPAVPEAQDPYAGALLRFRVGCQGLPEPLFAG